MKKITRKSAKHLVERKIMRIFAPENVKITMNNNTKNNTSDNTGVKSQWMDKLGDVNLLIRYLNINLFFDCRFVINQ